MSPEPPTRCRNGASTKGDRVAILSENRPEWSIADFAILLLGAVTVPVYATLTPEQTAYTLRDSGATVVFVSTEQQLRKVQAILSQTQVQKIVVMDHVEIPGDLAASCVLMDQFMTQGPLTLDPQTESSARSIQPDDLATIIYTSGTTGTSKGAMLTHGNMASNINCSLLGFDDAPRPDQRFVSSPLARHGAPRGSRHAVPRRHSRLLPVHRDSFRKLCWKCVPRSAFPFPGSTKKSMPRRR